MGEERDKTGEEKGRENKGSDGKRIPKMS